MGVVIWIRISRFATVLLLLLALLPAFAQTTMSRYPDAVWNPVRDAVDKTLRDHKIKGVSIAVVDDQTRVWSQGFGTADVFNHWKATSDTVYRLGTLSKLFTATAVMRLEDQGKLDIDRPLQAYLPQFSIQSRFPNAGSITVRSILCHHSGLPSDWLKGTWSHKPTPYTDYAKLLHDEYTAMPPNTMYAYSNIGYGLLAHMVQQVSGRSYEAYIEDVLLKPLGMKSSYCTRHEELDEHDAKIYVNGYENDVLPLGDAPGDTVYASVNDMARFMAMVMANGRGSGNQLLKPDTLAEMLHSQNANNPYDLDVNTALGWFREGASVGIPGYDGPIYGNAGATMTNDYTVLVILPREKIGIVILSNSTDIGPSLPAILRETVRAALRAKTGKEWASIQKPAAPKEVEIDHKARQAMTGTFATDYFALVDIYEKSDKLYASLGKIALEMDPRAGGALTIIPPRVLWFFSVPIGPFADMEYSVATVNGHRFLVQKANGYRQCVGESLQPPAISAAWKARLGNYVVTNTDADAISKMSVALVIDHGFLIARVTNASLPLAVALAPVNDKEAVTMGMGRFKGETLRVVTVQGQEMLEYSGFRLKKK